VTPGEIGPGEPTHHGVSIVVCYHNSAVRLQDTLRCLWAQEVEPGIPWEVIIVDNASNDGTGLRAAELWAGSRVATPLTVVCEPTAGLSFARVRGLEAARYEFVSFVDDDNHVSPQWVARVFRRMDSDPAIGGCGGHNTAAPEGDPPPWFAKYAGWFAVGRQWHEEGDITQARGWLFGAGLTVRREAWRRLRDGGFRFQTTDRQRKAVSGGGDNELCFALQMTGWKLWLDWDLELRHVIPRGRMTWDYLRSLYRGAGATSVILDAYADRRTDSLLGYLRCHWWWQVLSMLRQLMGHPAASLAYILGATREGDAILETEERVGRLASLLMRRGRYGDVLRSVQHAAWRISVLRSPPATP